MSSERASSASSARTTADFSGRGPAGGLAGLIDVLDRADGHPASGLRRRAGTHRPAGSRTGSIRTVPLRSVRPAPMARPAPAPAPATPPHVAPVAPVAATPVAPAGLLRGVTRRAALWGAGPRGEYLAWSSGPAHTGAHRPLLGGLLRRAALWGAGSRGEYLAWPVTPARPAPPADVDPPVVLRELPSTPTIQPAASSPAAALSPRGPAFSAGPQGARPVRSGAVPVPGVRPRGPAERSEATGWPSAARPSRARLSPVATGLVRARGDPVPPPVRGSPPPARRVRSSGSTWSSFP
jgi:hypothetical protein